MNNFSLQFSVAQSRIDAETGEILGVSLITEGAVCGHDCFADDQTIQTVLEACQKAGRVKVKQNHGTDVGSIVGSLRNFRIEGKQVRADLHLLKSSPSFEHVLEMAKEMPAQLGLSIAFKPEFETIKDKRFVRCSEIFSCDIVDTPACNPAGLFSKPVDDTDDSENDDNVEDTDNSENTDKADDDEDCTTVGVLNKLAALHKTALKTLTAHKKLLESYSADLADVKAQLTASNERFEMMADVVAALNSKIDLAKMELSSRVATEFDSKLAEQATQLESKMVSVDILACRKLAATGVPMHMVPSADVASSELSVLDKLNSISNPSEKAEFFANNKAEIYKAYQANLNNRLSREY